MHSLTLPNMTGGNVGLGNMGNATAGEARLLGVPVDGRTQFVTWLDNVFPGLSTSSNPVQVMMGMYSPAALKSALQDFELSDVDRLMSLYDTGIELPGLLGDHWHHALDKDWGNLKDTVTDAYECLSHNVGLFDRDAGGECSDVLGASADAESVACACGRRLLLFRNGACMRYIGKVEAISSNDFGPFENDGLVDHVLDQFPMLAPLKVMLHAAVQKDHVGMTECYRHYGGALTEAYYQRVAELKDIYG